MIQIYGTDSCKMQIPQNKLKQNARNMAVTRNMVVNTVHASGNEPRQETQSLEDDLIIDMEENHDQNMAENIPPNRVENNINQQASQNQTHANQTSNQAHASQTDSDIAGWIEK